MQLLQGSWTCMGNIQDYGNAWGVIKGYMNVYGPHQGFVGVHARTTLWDFVISLSVHQHAYKLEAILSSRSSELYYNIITLLFAVTSYP